MAGRIPQAFIDDLISRVDIVDLIDGFVPLKKAGKDYKACCPFHGEKTPSFTVSQEKQFYHCFGCGVHGTAIGFLIEYDQLSFVEAVEQLANKCGLTVPTDNFAASTPAPREGPDLYELLEKANDFYQQQLKTHADSKTAVDYLKNRGLDGEIAKRFGVGLAPEGWDNLMQHFGDPSNLVLPTTVPLQEFTSGPQLSLYPGNGSYGSDVSHTPEIFIGVVPLTFWYPNLILAPIPV